MQSANQCAQHPGTSVSSCCSTFRSAALSKRRTSRIHSGSMRRWQCTFNAESSQQHPAAVLLAWSVPFLLQNDAVAREASPWATKPEPNQCMTACQSDDPQPASSSAKKHVTADRPQNLLDLAIQDAPALGQPKCAPSADSADAQPPGSSSQPPLAAPLGTPDSASPSSAPQEQAGASQQSPLQDLSPPLNGSPPPSTLSPALTPAPAPGPSPDEAQKIEEEQRKSLRKTRRSRIKELEDTRAELAQKQQQLIDREKELLDKDQTVSTLREELDLERKLRGLLTKEKEKAEEQAALAMGLCTGAFALP